jgi:hypothetical protein
MRHRRTATVACGLLAVGATGLGAHALWTGSPAAGAAPAQTTPASTSAPKLATVETRDLERDKQLDGIVGRGDVRTLPVNAGGTVTKLPVVGTTLTSGQVLLEVDGQPVVLLAGERPAWRALQPGMTAGEDVRQLETALVAGGWATADHLDVDDTWTSATTKAVKAMQEAIGATQDRRLGLGEVVFGPATARVAKVTGEIGAPPTAVTIGVTSEDPSITAKLGATDASLAHVGDAVAIDLPTDVTIDGTITTVGAPVVGDDGKATIPLTVTAAGLDDLDGVPVDVNLRIVDASQVTAVPVSAIVALAGGGYAVEVPDTTRPSGTRYVAVKLGVFADGWVEIHGDVRSGDQVVVA